MFLAGATGGVGKRVVQALLNKGKAVRALVRDEQKARKLLVGYARHVCVCCAMLQCSSISEKGINNILRPMLPHLDLLSRHVL